MTHIIAKLYAVMDKRPLRALSFVMAIVLAGCMFWDPSRFAARTSTLEIWHGLLLMWAVCAGIIHGVGFRLNPYTGKGFSVRSLRISSLSSA